jgi:hypothetical protein
MDSKALAAGHTLRKGQAVGEAVGEAAGKVKRPNYSHPAGTSIMTWGGHGGLCTVFLVFLRPCQPHAPGLIWVASTRYDRRRR